MAITAAQVKELRERTGAGMMECKKALVAVDGDMDAAIKSLREAGAAKADKKAGRTTAEGLVVIARDGNRAIVLEANCETDFVARDENFVQFVNAAAQTALQNNISDITELSNATLDSGDSVEKARQNLIAKIGENIQLRRIAIVECDGEIGTYTHGGRIGVLVAVNGGDDALAKDLAMHIAASKPVVVDAADVPADLVAAEKEIFVKQAENAGKPANIIEKMVMGWEKKFVGEVSLLGQGFVKEPKQTVAQLLQQHNAKVDQFIRFEVGEGIEKKEDNFVEEVMAQVREA